MSKETRTIRPYVGIDALERILDRSLLHFGKETCEPGSTLVVESAPHEYLLRPIVLSLAPDDPSFTSLVDELEEGASGADLPLDALALVVVAWSSFLRTTSTVARFSLGDRSEIPRSLMLSEGERPSALRSPFGGFVVECYLYLDRSLEPQPLRPHLRGTWLSRARFNVSTSHGPAVLPPTPLTDDVRTRYDLPPKAMRYVHFGDHDLLSPFRDSEQPVYYIDEAVLAQMTARKGSQTSKALQAQLVLDFVAAVVRRASSNADELTEMTYEDLSDSLLGHVVRLAAGSGASETDRARVLDWVVSEPERVVAYAENSIGVGDGFNKALQDGDR